MILLVRSKAEVKISTRDQAKESASNALITLTKSPTENPNGIGIF